MLNINGISKTYKGGKKAVDDLSLFIASGEIYGFIGHNGAGKTTTLKACAGILPIDEGEIRINGISMKKDPVACKQMMAFLPDNPDLYEYLTGMQYLNFLCDIYGIDSHTRQMRIQKHAEELELQNDLGELIGTYSHGMKQKLALIGAFTHEPKLLILDEPFVGLDPKAAFILKGKMREMCDKGGAIFFSTHVLDVAEKLCDKIAIIKQGKLIADGKTDVVRGNESLESVFMELIEQ